MLKVKVKRNINEKLVINKSKTPETLLERIEYALPELEEAIIHRLGNDASLRNFDFGFTVKETTNRDGKQQFTIESNNLIELTGPIGKITYDEFKFATWGGTITKEKDAIWFNPKFEFHYIGGGSNGSDAFWYGMWFLLEDNTWKFGREIN